MASLPGAVLCVDQACRVRYRSGPLLDRLDLANIALGDALPERAGAAGAIRRAVLRAIAGEDVLVSVATHDVAVELRFSPKFKDDGTIHGASGVRLDLSERRDMEELIAYHATHAVRTRCHRFIEVGTIGREGMSAFPLLMGASATANSCYCQVLGTAIRIPAEVFHSLAASEPAFRQVLDRYLQAYVNMLGQLAACNRLHSISERCARWLLMTRDRVDVDRLPLTQEFLAMMLGTGRSGVAIAAATLQNAGFIKYAPGTIDIVDRAGLESAACECYQVARDQFGGLLRSVSASMTR